MMRIVIENIAIFMIPTLVYAAWIVLRMPAGEKGTREAYQRIINEAPLLWLFTAGVILVVLTLIAFNSTEGGRPGESYTSPKFEDGQITPSQIGRDKKN